jgi:hypothetical protein
VARCDVKVRVARIFESAQTVILQFVRRRVNRANASGLVYYRAGSTGSLVVRAGS